MSDEKESTKNMLLLQEYQERMDAIYQQVRFIEELLGEYRRVKSALDEISKAKKDDELILPIGGNVFVRASLEDNSNVLTGVGGGVVTEKSINKAVSFVDKKIEELLKEEDSLIETSQDLKAKVEELSKKLRYADS